MESLGRPKAASGSAQVKPLDHPIDDHSHSHGVGSESDHHSHSAGDVTVCQHVDQKSIGLALALGFLFMLLVDRASGGAHPHLEHHGHGHGHAHTSHSTGNHSSRSLTSHSTSSGTASSNSPVARRAPANNEEEVELLGGIEHRASASPRRTGLAGDAKSDSASSSLAVNTLSDLELGGSAKPKFSSATIGLVVHSAFDGELDAVSRDIFFLATFLNVVFDFSVCVRVLSVLSALSIVFISVSLDMGTGMLPKPTMIRCLTRAVALSCVVDEELQPLASGGADTDSTAEQSEAAVVGEPTSAGNSDSPAVMNSPPPADVPRGKFSSATVGLVVHSAFDGAP